MAAPQPGGAVLICGSSGLIGTRVVQLLTELGVAVRRLVRRDPRAPDEVVWSPLDGELDPAVFDGVGGVLVLSGAGIGDRRWTEGYRRELLLSRIRPVGLVANGMVRAGSHARLVAASAVGIYGDRGDEVLTETSPAGTGFLPALCQAWEAAADPARAAGLSVACARSGIVLDRSGGALAKMLPLLRLGLGGPMGSGRQWWPWITLEDEARALVHLLTSSLTGPVNLTAPEPERNGDLMRELAAQLRRPARVPAPGLALRAALGGFGAELLASQRVVPSALLADGFAFATPTIADAAAHLVR